MHRRGQTITSVRVGGLLLLLSAGPAESLAAGVRNPDVLVYAQRDDNGPIDPAWTPDFDGQHVIANLYDTLFEYVGDSITRIGPRLATTVPSQSNGLVSADGLSFRVPMRHGIQFHDGTVLTTEDVRYSLLRQIFVNCGAINPLTQALLGLRSACDERGVVADGVYQSAAAAVEAAPTDVTLRLKEPFAPLLALLATNSGIILSKRWCVEHGEWDGSQSTLASAARSRRDQSYLLGHANGTGPFRLERWDRTNREIVLAANEGYWRGRPRLKKVVLKAVPDLAARRLMLKNGDADIMDASIVEWPLVKGMDGVEILEGLQPPMRNPLLFFNFAINAAGNADIGSGRLDGDGIPPDFFTDAEVRRGFAHAFDYDAYIREVLRGRARRASGFIPPGLSGYSRDGLIHRYDPGEAAEHFRKARGGELWAKGFKFTILMNAGSAWRPSLVKILRDALQRINPKFVLESRSVPWSTFLDRSAQRKIPIFVTGDAPQYADTHPLAMAFLHSRGDYQSRMGYSNAEVDRLIEAAAREADPSSREALYGELQRIAFDDIPFVVIDEPEGDTLRVQRSWVKGYVFNPIFPGAPSSSYYFDLHKE